MLRGKIHGGYLTPSAIVVRACMKAPSLEGTGSTSGLQQKQMLSLYACPSCYQLFGLYLLAIYGEALIY